MWDGPIFLMGGPHSTKEEPLFGGGTSLQNTPPTQKKVGGASVHWGRSLSIGGRSLSVVGEVLTTTTLDRLPSPLQWRRGRRRKRSPWIPPLAWWSWCSVWRVAAPDTGTTDKALHQPWDESDRGGSWSPRRIEKMHVFRCRRCVYFVVEDACISL